MKKVGNSLIVRVPEQCMQFVEDQKVIRLNIDSMVQRPREGVKFVSTDLMTTDEEKMAVGGAHMFTYRSSHLSSTREWLPCADEPNQLCIWRFEVTVPSEWTAICCGDLITVSSSPDDDTCKTFQYQLLVPTSAGNIGFVIGDFQMYVQPEMPEIISFALPQMLPLLKHTLSSLNRIFTFFEELLSCRFPYGTYWQVFVDQTPDEVTSFAGLSIFSLRVLYHKKILDIVQQSRKLLAKAIAHQFFGCFISPLDFTEIWIVKAISSFIVGIFVERFFGASESLYQLNRSLREACEYETRFGCIVLCTDPMVGRIKTGSGGSPNKSHFDHSRPETCSPLYLDALGKKGHFIMRMLERRLPKEQLMKVLQRILSIGMQHTQSLSRPPEWAKLLLSTRDFVRIVTDMTGQELSSFLDKWVDSGGYVQFQITHAFNRKRNVIELEVRQANPPPIGCQSYAGPLTIAVQELDGHFVHTIQVDAIVSKHDIPCHSKGRKLKRKRIVLSTGEEMDMDLAQMDADSAVLWIRVDPELLLYRQMAVNQPFYQWEFILLHERDVLAQQQAVEYLYRFPGHQARIILEDTVQNEKFFYLIRREAAHCLVHVYNSLPESQLGECLPIIDYFRQHFGSKTCPDIPKPNNYVATASNLQNYFLQQTLPAAMGSIRGQGGKLCPDYVVDFLLGLIRFNDNSANRYSDDYYRGALIHALGKTLVMAERPVDHPEGLSVQARSILEETTHALNMDTMKQSFGRIISIHCLQVLFELQRCHHIPLDTEVFWKFGLSKHVYAPLRFAAFACIVSMIRRSRLPVFVGTVLRLVEVTLSDPDPYIRISLANRLCTLPPFEANDNIHLFPMNTKRLAYLLWSAVSNPAIGARLRTYLTDLYFLLYGVGTPHNFSSF